MLGKKRKSAILSISEALPLPLGGGREGLADRHDRSSEASVERNVLQSDSEASRNQRCLVFSMRLTHSGRFLRPAVAFPSAPASEMLCMIPLFVSA
jgi:hypothetical protein